MNKILIQCTFILAIGLMLPMHSYADIAEQSTPTETRTHVPKPDSIQRRWIKDMFVGASAATLFLISSHLLKHGSSKNNSLHLASSIHENGIYSPEKLEEQVQLIHENPETVKLADLKTDIRSSHIPLSKCDIAITILGATILYPTARIFYFIGKEIWTGRSTFFTDDSI